MIDGIKRKLDELKQRAKQRKCLANKTPCESYSKQLEEDAEILYKDQLDAINDSLKEVEEIRNGKLPKHSYKEMMNRIKENLKEDVNSSKHKSKVPHLKVVNGEVQIDDNDPLQEKWFEEFKKLNISTEKLKEISVTPKIVDGKILFDKNNPDHRYIVDDE